MAGETSLSLLLGSMSPRLNPGDYVFCTLADAAALNGCVPLGSLREREGLTVVANVGDQLSDLRGGAAQHTFKVPNPMYVIESA